MSYKDIQKKDDKALVEFVKEKREAIRDFRFQNAGSSTRNVRQVREDKKEVARALTELNARAKAKAAESKNNNDQRMSNETNTNTGGGRVLRGTVVASKMQDTITVAVERYVKHPKYKKYLRRTKKYLVHDAGNTATVGQKVEIKETRPMSKRKRFTLVKA